MSFKRGVYGIILSFCSIKGNREDPHSRVIQFLHRSIPLIRSLLIMKAYAPFSSHALHTVARSYSFFKSFCFSFASFNVSLSGGSDGGGGGGCVAESNDDDAGSVAFVFDVDTDEVFFLGEAVVVVVVVAMFVG